MSYDYRAGVSGTVTIDAGKIFGAAAHAPVGSNATCTVNGGDAIPVPPGGQIELDTDAVDLNGPVTFVFTGTDSFWVEFSP